MMRELAIVSVKLNAGLTFIWNIHKIQKHSGMENKFKQHTPIRSQGFSRRHKIFEAIASNSSDSYDVDGKARVEH